MGIPPEPVVSLWMHLIFSNSWSSHWGQPYLYLEFNILLYLFRLNLYDHKGFTRLMIYQTLCDITYHST